MNDSQTGGNILTRKIVGGLAIVLFCAGAMLLALTLIPRFRTDSLLRVTPAATTSLSAPPEYSHPDGKILPPGSQSASLPFDAIPPSVDQRPIPDQAAADLDRLFAVSQPIHDYFGAKGELSGQDAGTRIIAREPEQVGDRAIFHTNDGPRQAELVYMDDLAAYWIESGLTLDRKALLAAADRLRSRYYPLLNRYIGNEWKPGIDGDPLFTILHVLSAPETIELGYFTDENEYPRSLFSHSNEREMIYLNMTQLAPGPLYDGTLVHEVQHLIQWNLDANEDKWFNEGLSQLAETLTGLNTVDPRPYLEQTNIRLDRWPDQSGDIHPHYAASYLYLLYFWEQLGDAALTELARHPANGLAAVRAVLAGHQSSLSLESFTADWATALFLDGTSSDPRANVAHHSLPQPFFADRVRQLPFEGVSQIEQYAVDYIDLDFSGAATLTFAGDTLVELVDNPPDGGSIWYAPPANSSRSQLTAAVDLSGLSSATLSFSAWYDLEQDYDFAYLSVSTDGGQNWRLLDTNYGIIGAYGPAWGGTSTTALENKNGWIQESVDLDAYAGQSVQLRFDVLTDFEKFGRGFAVTDLSVSQIATQPDWRPQGFVETGSVVPQQWQVRLIREGQSPEVIPLVLDGLNRVQTLVDLGSEGGVLIIMPLTPFTDSAAEYWLSIDD